MTMSEWAYVALGSNIGDRGRYLSLGRERLAALPQTTLCAESSIEETEPVGPVPQRRYLNQMVLLDTELTPLGLLDECFQIESEAGRRRRVRWGPRTLDLDIVIYGDHTINEKDLAIPHPELANRDFWQREIAELEPYARR
jgi:2-amino-4-hydroxy-6-hydroxymethyldihydropteridine diphosphokinase